MAQVGTITKTGAFEKPFKANNVSGVLLGFFESVAKAQQAFREVHAGKVKFIREDLPGAVEFYRVEDL